MQIKKPIIKKLKEKEYQDNLKIIDVKISTNRDVANIYFKPLNDKYHRAEICLYTARGSYPDRGYMNHISVKTQPIGGKIDQLIGKYEVHEDKFFCSIDKLARRTYAVKVVQYDKDDKELITSDHHYFDI